MTRTPAEQQTSLIGSSRVISLLAVSLLAAGCAGPGEAERGGSGGRADGPLAGAEIMAFVATNDAAKARAFYEGKLGLAFLEEDDFAIVLESNGTRIRVQKAKSYQPPSFTVMGWRVRDIAAAAERLSKAGVKLERYEWMNMQDERCIATFANGDKVAWFKDPDGNILSIAQLVR